MFDLTRWVALGIRTGGRHSWRFKKSGAGVCWGYLFAFLETMLGGYVSFVDSQVTLVWALLVLIIVLFVRLG